ncbi:MAG: VOC family protein [Saprospiraceae bacterium]|nr:VOC family protein [Saprospiraceae bacterium]
MNQSIFQISILVDDYDTAIKYYTASLGFELVEDTKLTEEKRWVVVKPVGEGGIQLLLAKASNEDQLKFVGNQSGGRVFLFLKTDNFWEDYHQMKLKNINFVRDPIEESYGIVAVFKDLYGNLWDFIQPK